MGKYTTKIGTYYQTEGTWHTKILGIVPSTKWNKNGTWSSWILTLVTKSRPWVVSRPCWIMPTNFHLAVLDVQNKRRLRHDRKWERTWCWIIDEKGVKRVTYEDAKESWLCQKNIETRYDTNPTDGFETKGRSDLGKKETLFLVTKKVGITKPLLMQWRIWLFCSSSLERPGSH